MERLNDPAYMKKYLKYAAEFEKYVYIWTHAMAQANTRIQQIHSERNRLARESICAEQNLTALSNGSDPSLQEKKKALSKKRTRTIVLLIIISLILLVFFFIGYTKGNSNIVMGLFGMFYGSLFTGGLPICGILLLINMKKTSDLKAEIKNLTAEDSLRRQKMILEAKANDAKTLSSALTSEETQVRHRQEEIQKALIAAKTNLQQIYSINVLPMKYRNLNAAITMYEYLETGQCNTVQGHGGIYDTYETERRHLEQLEQLIKANATLSRIEDTNRRIYQELQEANRTLSNISSSLKAIERTNEEIAENTAISAVANQQTAAATQWLAWNAWSRGY